MKQLIALVVAVGLVRVQGSSIIRHVMSSVLGHTDGHDQTNFDGRNSMLAGQILNKIRNKGASENDILEKTERSSYECTESSCKFCKAIWCITLNYDSPSNSFGLRGVILGKDKYNKTIHVKPWTDCDIIDTPLGKVMSCVTFSKVKIMDGRVCADGEVNAGRLMKKTFVDICF